jgi:hypothetical protein
VSKFDARRIAVGAGLTRNNQQPESNPALLHLRDDAAAVKDRLQEVVRPPLGCGIGVVGLARRGDALFVFIHGGFG